jgi:hypothetical protein
MYLVEIDVFLEGEEPFGCLKPECLGLELGLDVLGVFVMAGLGASLDWL